MATDRDERAERLETLLQTAAGRARFDAGVRFLAAVAPQVLQRVHTTLTENQRKAGSAFAAALCADRMSRALLHVLSSEDVKRADNETDGTEGREASW